MEDVEKEGGGDGMRVVYWVPGSHNSPQRVKVQQEQDYHSISIVRNVGGGSYTQSIREEKYNESGSRVYTKEMILPRVGVELLKYSP